MGSSVSNSTSNSVSPLNDIKPTLQDSPTDFFINRTATNNGSNVGESLLGDSFGYGNLHKSASTFGDALTNSSINYSLSGGSTITDGGAVMAMFNIAKAALDQNSTSSVIKALQAEKTETGQSSGSETVDDALTKIKDFVKENKVIFIAGGLLLGYFIYKGVTK